MFHSVHRLHLAKVNLAGQHNPPDFEDTRLNVFAYLVIAGNDLILMDTGIGEGDDFIESTFKPDKTSIVEELSRFNIEPQDVNIIVNSHLHFDHCGNNALFPRAKFFIQQSELETARSTPYTINDWFDFKGARIQALDGNYEIVPGVRIISSPGHTPGHQSLMVSCQDVDTLIAAQVALSVDEYQRGGDPHLQAHEGLEDTYVETLAQMKMIAGARVLLSHDDREVTNL